MDNFKINVLIADNEIGFANHLKVLLEKEKFFNVIAIAVDGVEATSKILSSNPKPDIIIIDYYLIGVNAITLINNAYRYMEPLRIPYIITLPYFDDRVCHYALNQGASGFYIKHTAPSELIHAIFSALRLEKPEIPSTPSVIYDDRYLRKNLRLFFIYTGISMKNKGLDILVDAILLCIKDATVLEDITNRIYRELVQEYYPETNRDIKKREISVASIAANISHAIETAWKDDCFASAGIHFEIEIKTGKPSNAEFIGKVADIFRTNPDVFKHLTDPSSIRK